MDQRMSFLVRTDEIRLSDEGEVPSSWIHAMSVGEYNHPTYGKLSFTPERLQRFADSVNNRVRGITPDIDYDHKVHGGDAAGWVKQARVDGTGLHLYVEWTGTAASKIRDRAYKYFSPEFVDEWEHPQTKTKFKDVLNGGAITNRPFLKDLQPLNLSELLDRADEPERNEMDPKKLAELLGLPETATEEQILAKAKEIKELAEKPPTLPTPPTPAPVEDELKKLSESNPAIKALMDRLAETEKQNAINAATLRLAEVKGTVMTLNESLRPKNVALPATTFDGLTKILHESPAQVGKQVVELVKALGETGFVKLGEIGSSNPGNNNGDPIRYFTDKVAALQKDGTMAYADAVQTVALAEPLAYQAYAEASYAVAPGGDN